MWVISGWAAGDFVALLDLRRQQPVEPFPADHATAVKLRLEVAAVDQDRPDLFRFLMVKFLDGNIKQEEDGVFLTNQWGKYPIVEHPEYPEWWLRLIVETTGDRFLYLEDEEGS